MPIFEADEPITAKEMKRQQRQLNDKILRRETIKLMHELDHDEDDPNGDCWLDEPPEETDEVH